MVCVCGGKVRQRDAPAKLSAFYPKEDLTEGRFSWDVEKKNEFCDGREWK